MTDQTDSKPGTTYYVIAGIFLAWNLIGMMFYYQQMTLTPEVMAGAGMSEAQIAWIEATPVWANFAYATAVTLGVIASLLLLVRNRLAVPAFIVSLLGIIVQDFESFVLRNPAEAWGTGAFYLPAVVFIIAVVEILFARASRAKGRLK